MVHIWRKSPCATSFPTWRIEVERFPVLLCVSSYHLNDCFPTSHCHYFAVIIAFVERKDWSFAFLLLWLSEHKWNCIHFPLFWTTRTWHGGGVRRGDWEEAGRGSGMNMGPVPHVAQTLSWILSHGWPYTSLSTVLWPRCYLHSAHKNQQDQKGWVSHPKQLCAGALWTQIPVGTAAVHFLWSQCDLEEQGLHGGSGDLRTVIETFWASFFSFTKGRAWTWWAQRHYLV